MRMRGAICSTCSFVYAKHSTNHLFNTYLSGPNSTVRFIFVTEACFPSDAD